jgi:hypothetical protein
MLSYIKAKGGVRGEGPKKDDARPSSSTSGSSDGSERDEDFNRAKDPTLFVMAPAPTKKVKHQSPQDAIDEFWGKFNSKTPGRGKQTQIFIQLGVKANGIPLSIHHPPQEQDCDKSERIGPKGRHQGRERRRVVRRGRSDLQRQSCEDRQRMPARQPEISRSPFRHRVRLEMGCVGLPDSTSRHNRGRCWIPAWVCEESLRHL